jgi:hypothetical protein
LGLHNQREKKENGEFAVYSGKRRKMANSLFIRENGGLLINYYENTGVGRGQGKKRIGGKFSVAFRSVSVMFPQIFDSYFKYFSIFFIIF